MNTDWFRQLLAARKLSQRGLSKLLDLDAAAVSLMLRGQRRMTTHEAHQISVILGVPVTEVLRQAGIAVVDDVRSVKVVGFIDSDAKVTLFPARTHDTVIGPADCPAGTYSLQARTPGSPRDGWMYFISPAQDDPSDHLGHTCCVALENGEHTIAMLTRGYRGGTFNLLRVNDGGLLRTDSRSLGHPPCSGSNQTDGKTTNHFSLICLLFFSHHCVVITSAAHTTTTTEQTK